MWRRQSRHNLHELLGFDPLTITSPKQAGFGAGSGAPHVMFGYLKHLWATGDRKDALHRYTNLHCHYCAYLYCILVDLIVYLYTVEHRHHHCLFTVKISALLVYVNVTGLSWLCFLKPFPLAPLLLPWLHA